MLNSRKSFEAKSRGKADGSTPVMSFEDLAGLRYLEKMLEDHWVCQGGVQVLLSER